MRAPVVERVDDIARLGQSGLVDPVLFQSASEILEPVPDLAVHAVMVAPVAGHHLASTDYLAHCLVQREGDDVVPGSGVRAVASRVRATGLAQPAATVGAKQGMGASVHGFAHFVSFTHTVKSGRF